MLSNIKISNFKPFGEGKSVRLAPITLIYGPNSSGKSSIIQSLLLLRQTMDGKHSGSKNELVTRGELADLGNFLSILHRHEAQRKLKLEFEFAPKTTGFRNRPDHVAGVSLTFASRPYALNEVRAVLDAVDFKAVDENGQNFSFQLERCDSSIPPLRVQEEEEEEEEEEEVSDFKFGANSDLNAVCKLAQRLENERGPNRLRPSVQPRPPYDSAYFEAIKEKVMALRFRPGASHPIDREFLPSRSREIARQRNGEAALPNFRAVMWSFDIRFRRTVGALTYLGPLRAHPARMYSLQGIPDSSVGAQGEQAVQILYQNLGLTDRGRGTSLLNRLNERCRQFEIPYIFDLQPLGNEITGDYVVLSLLDTRTGVSVAPTDVGFGIGQLIPILIEGMVASERQSSDALVCVEQPEIHLHPRLQAAMADFFIDTACLSARSDRTQRSSGGVQWILETHSEALILRLQRRIREKRLLPADVSVLYVEHLGERGSVIQELRLDEEGEFLDLWPDGFFVESFS